MCFFLTKTIGIIKINFGHYVGKYSPIETRVKLRLNLMRRLAGTMWRADAKILKTVYTESMRPALEYGMAASCTSAASHIDRLNRVQNLAARLNAGGMKSTLIQGSYRESSP